MIRRAATISTAIIPAEDSSSWTICVSLAGVVYAADIGMGEGNKADYLTNLSVYYDSTAQQMAYSSTLCFCNANESRILSASNAAFNAMATGSACSTISFIKKGKGVRARSYSPLTKNAEKFSTFFVGERQTK